MESESRLGQLRHPDLRTRSDAMNDAHTGDDEGGSHTVTWVHKHTGVSQDIQLFQLFLNLRTTGHYCLK